MSKSKKVSVSKQQLAETGEDLEVVGVVAKLEGENQMVEGAEDLEVAQDRRQDRRSAMSQPGRVI